MSFPLNEDLEETSEETSPNFKVKVDLQLERSCTSSNKLIKCNCVVFLSFSMFYLFDPIC